MRLRRRAINFLALMGNLYRVLLHDTKELPLPKSLKGRKCEEKQSVFAQKRSSHGITVIMLHELETSDVENGRGAPKMPCGSW